MGFSKFNSGAHTSDVLLRGEGVKWGLKEGFILGLTFGCQQTVDSAGGHESGGRHPRSVGTERREGKSHCVPGVALGPGDPAGAKEGTCCHRAAPCQRHWKAMGSVPASPGSSLSRPEISVGVT